MPAFGIGGGARRALGVSRRIVAVASCPAPTWISCDRDERDLRIDGLLLFLDPKAGAR
jgi:hypothetical protein